MRLFAGQAIISLISAAVILGAPAEIPELRSPVMDTAGILSVDRELDAALQNYMAKTGVQIAVLTVMDMGDLPIEEYSIRVAEKWQLGEKEKDNGVLLLVAVNAHKVRIEVGYGLEHLLTDYTCGVIIRERITPRFREGDYDGGVVDGLRSITSVLSREIAADPELQKKDDREGALAPIIAIIMIVLFLRLFRRDPVSALILGSMIGRMGGSRSFRSGGFGGGGFGGFSGGGGGFGGGGASGGW